jgi:hypothetical protein
MNAGRRPQRGAFVLDPRDPMQAARALVAARFVNDDHRLLHRHRGTFWRFQVNHYAFADQETVRGEVWTFLEQAQRRGQGNKLVPFKPNRASVSDVLDALASAHAASTIASIRRPGSTVPTSCPPPPRCCRSPTAYCTYQAGNSTH